MYQSLSISVCILVCLHVCLCLSVSICLSVYLTVCVVSLCLFVSTSVYLSMFLPVCISWSVCLSVCLSYKRDERPRPDQTRPRPLSSAASSKEIQVLSHTPNKRICANIKEQFY